MTEIKKLVERYLKTRTGVRPSTKANDGFVQNLMEREKDVVDRPVTRAMFKAV